MPKINSLEVVHQDTNKDPYQNLHDILKGLLTNKTTETIDGSARAQIENLLEMYANDKEAFLRSLQTLTAQFETSQAQYSEEILLIASKLRAQASRTLKLTAQTESQYASVMEYSEAVASEVDRKVSTYRQDEPPTENLTYGDLWFDTNNENRLYWWNGLVWTESSDTYDLSDFISTTYATDYAAIEAQVDSKAETWFQETDPSTAWTTQPIRDMHDKDMWYKASTKLLKIYVAASNTWTTVQDQTAINAAAAASTAQSTADGKIVTFVQTSAPTAGAIGDLWMDSDDNRKMYRWSGSSWVAVDDSRIANTYARWGVQVDVNGRVAGIQLNSNSTGTSEFTVLADAFKVYKSGYTSSPMFSVGAVNGTTTVAINGNLVVDGSIITRGIASNAVTVPAASQSNSVIAMAPPFNTYVEMISLPFTSSGAPKLIQVVAETNGIDEDLTTFTLYRRNSGGAETLVGSCSLRNQVQSNAVIFALDSFSTPGTYTYVVKAYVARPSGSLSNVRISNYRTISILEVKR